MLQLEIAVKLHWFTLVGTALIPLKGLCKVMEAIIERAGAAQSLCATYVITFHVVAFHVHN